MTDAIKKAAKLVKPSDGSKPVWGRSSVAMVVALLSGLRAVAPDTPWEAYVALAVISLCVLALQQIFAPSVARKDLPR